MRGYKMEMNSRLSSPQKLVRFAEPLTNDKKNTNNYTTGFSTPVTAPYENAKDVDISPDRVKNTNETQTLNSILKQKGTVLRPTIQTLKPELPTFRSIADSDDESIDEEVACATKYLVKSDIVRCSSRIGSSSGEVDLFNTEASAASLFLSQGSVEDTRKTILDILNSEHAYDRFDQSGLITLRNLIFNNCSISDNPFKRNVGQIETRAFLIRDAFELIAKDEETTAKGSNYNQNKLSILFAIEELENSIKHKYEDERCDFKEFSILDSILEITKSPIYKDFMALIISDTLLSIMKADSSYDPFNRADHDTIADTLRGRLSFLKSPKIYTRKEFYAAPFKIRRAIENSKIEIKENASLLRKALRQISKNEFRGNESSQYFRNKVALYNTLFTFHLDIKNKRQTDLLNRKENPQFFPHFKKRERVPLSSLFNNKDFGDIRKPIIRNQNSIFVFTNSTETEKEKRSLSQVGKGEYSRAREFIIVPFKVENQQSHLDITALQTGVVKKANPGDLIEHINCFSEVEIGKKLNAANITVAPSSGFSYADSKSKLPAGQKPSVLMLMQKEKPINIKTINSEYDKHDNYNYLSGYVFQSAVRLGDLHKLGFAHRDYCMDNTLDVGKDSLSLRLSDLGSVCDLSSDKDLLRPDDLKNLGHFPNPESVSKYSGEEIDVDFQKSDTFAWASDLLYVLSRLPGNEWIPTYKADYCKNTEERKNNIYKWVEDTLVALNEQDHVVGQVQLKEALIIALSPQESRPTMTELCDVIFKGIEFHREELSTT
jgi:hypothetical protein